MSQPIVFTREEIELLLQALARRRGELEERARELKLCGERVSSLSRERLTRLVQEHSALERKLVEARGSSV